MKKDVQVIAIFAAIVAFWLWWHWAITWNNSTSASLLRVYLLHNEHSHKGVAGFADLVFPAALIGFLTGCIGWQWRLSRLAIYVFVFGVVLACLRPLYAMLLTVEMAWWWPKDPNSAAYLLMGNMIGALAILGVCVYGGRIYRIEK